MKAKEEELEKNLAAQRAKMQREYEEEQKRQKAKTEVRSLSGKRSGDLLNHPFVFSH